MNLEFIGMGAGVVMLLSLPLLYYSMFTKLEAAEGYLPHSVFIVSCKHLFRSWPLDGRPLRLNLMAYVLVMPKVFYWRRLVDLDEVASVPGQLKRWIIIPCAITHLAALIMTAAGLMLT
ncbi:hypothetical protein NUV89_08810 [Pseudomonas sp. 18.1.10]|uniref:hypothetical protein n=1 Tax=Pseudomonas sp. 18.1.10 TaxID=2969302 RepID=UPI00214F788F|nr:hypothetical protein [Pseudomonas sp. 18.1.10]MCR4538489.1 hypothetical protein [Pseudomonas sp. 18.1.10]